MSHYQPPTSSLDLSTFPIPPDFFPNLAAYWRPPVQHTLSSWAEENITLSSEYSASSSNLHLFGWQREIFDSFTDPSVRQSVCCVSTQSVKTLFLQSAIAYTVAQDPGPILLVQPNDDDARTFSKERLTPMIRDNECLRSRIHDNKADGQSTLVGKLFNGGSLSIVGAVAPGNLARRTIRYLFCDEIDKYPANARTAKAGPGSGEGDPIRLGMERLASFRSRQKSILCCSPTVEATSRIGKAYENSDKRRPWVPCPYCKQKQVMKWSQVKWDSSLAREKQSLSAYYQCLHCSGRWSDYQRRQAAEATEWRAEKPFAGIAGFWISQLYVPWKDLSEIVENFLQVKDIPSELQVFVNTVLAEQWKDAGDMPDHEVLYARREDYPFGSDAIIPQRALFLTAFTDVQDNPPRLETEVVAWGRHRENWSVAYEVTQVFADDGSAYPVTSAKLWDELDKNILQRNWLHESGKYLPIMAMGVDTGNRPKPVYEFARRHPQLAHNPAVGLKLTAIRTVVPTKGNDDALRILSKVSKEDAVRKRQGVRILNVGTHAAKQEIFDGLRNIKPRLDGKTLSGIPTPACYHHPMYEAGYFLALTAEARVTDPKTFKVTYEKRRERNEALDTAVGNRAMAAVVGIDRFTEEQWRVMEEALEAAPDTSTLLPKSNVVEADSDSAVVESESSSVPPAAGVSAHVGAAAPSTASSRTPVAAPTPQRPSPQPQSPPQSPRNRVRARFM